MERALKNKHFFRFSEWKFTECAIETAISHPYHRKCLSLWRRHTPPMFKQAQEKAYLVFTANCFTLIKFCWHFQSCFLGDAHHEMFWPKSRSTCLSRFSSHDRHTNHGLTRVSFIALFDLTAQLNPARLTCLRNKHQDPSKAASITPSTFVCTVTFAFKLVATQYPSLTARNLSDRE